MPIDPDFPRNHKVIGKHNHADGEHFHFVWGPGRPDAEIRTNPSHIIEFLIFDIWLSLFFFMN